VAGIPRPCGSILSLGLAWAQVRWRRHDHVVVGRGVVEALLLADLDELTPLDGQLGMASSYCGVSGGESYSLSPRRPEQRLEHGLYADQSHHVESMTKVGSSIIW
jgi:hypothetical protein